MIELCKIAQFQGGPQNLSAVGIGRYLRLCSPEVVLMLLADAARYQHIKSTWHDGGLLERLKENTLPEDWSAAIDADMSAAPHELPSTLSDWATAGFNAKQMSKEG
ncbi:hypothetical protein [Pseudomonas brassicacearum]|nr:hypothetical protein [Pseudomonas brassicacearum]